MTNGKSRSLESRIVLIYEFDNSSPLFARVAAIEYDKNNYSKAAEIIEKNLESYPLYPTPYIIYGNCLAMLGEFEKAEVNYKKGCAILNSKPALDFYINKLENLRKGSRVFSDSRRPSFLGEETVKDAGDGELEKLAKSIEGARIDIKKGSSSPEERYRENNFNKTELVSETIAEIYLAQGNLSEALEVYRKLIAKNPDKKTGYEEKIKEIENQIRRRNL